MNADALDKDRYSPLKVSLTHHNLGKHQNSAVTLQGISYNHSETDHLGDMTHNKHKMGYHMNPRNVITM